MVIVKRVDKVSVGKIVALIYAIYGLIVGILFSLIFLLEGELELTAGLSFLLPNPSILFPVISLFEGARAGGDFSRVLFGLGLIIYISIMYGIKAFIGGVLTAFVYNLAAGWVGGIKLETE